MTTHGTMPNRCMINNMRYFYVCLTDYVTHGGDVFGIRNDSTEASSYGLPSDILARIVNNGPNPPHLLRPV